MGVNGFAGDGWRLKLLSQLLMAQLARWQLAQDWRVMLLVSLITAFFPRYLGCGFPIR